MADQIAFRQGQNQHFIAARSFALGKSGVQVPKGADVMYDGSTAEVGGDRHVIPELRGAIRAGWLVPQASYDEDDNSASIPVAANIQIRPADGGNPLHKPVMQAMSAATEADEREVGNTKSHAKAVNQRNTGHRPGSPIAANPGGSAEMQDGVPVRSLKTATGSKAMNSRTVITASSIGAQLSEAKSSGVINPGQGVSEEEYLDRMTPQAREEYLGKKESIRARYVDTAPVEVTKIASKELGRKDHGGMVATSSTGKGSTAIFDASGSDGKPKIETFEQDGMKFTTTNGPSRKDQPSPRSAEAQKPVMLKDGTVDARRMIAKQMCPEFPDLYDFAQSPRKKLARIQADFEGNTPIIRAIFASESDDFKATLMQEFPEAFSG